MQLKIRSKVVLLANLCITLPLIILISIIWVEKNTAAEENIKIVTEMTEKNLGQVAKDVYAICETSNSILQSKLNSTLELLNEQVDARGGLNINSGMVQWDAENQFMQQSLSFELPKFYLGNQWLGNSKDLTSKTPLIDKLGKTMDVAISVFQRVNDAGDMIRVATNAPDTNGKRTLGTFYTAQNPDGSPNPVIQTILNKQNFRGSDYVVGKVYLTIYQPIVDNSGKVIGILSVGVRQEQDEGLRHSIMDIEVGNDGYVFVLQANGRNKGAYVIANDERRVGENLLNSENKAVVKVAEDVIGLATNLKGKDAATYTYFWQNLDEKQPREKITMVTYFEPWDWAIGVSAYKSDFMEISDKMMDILINLIWIAIITALIINAALGLFVFWYAKKMMKPLDDIAIVADELAFGNLKSNIDYDKKDEIGLLAGSFRNMKSTLESVITELSDITDSTTKGQLDKRCNSFKFSGSYKDIVIGVNDTLDAVIKPLNMTAEYIDRVSKGDIPTKITDDYKGDFNEIKNNINQLIDTLNYFVNDMLNMYNQQKAGDIEVMMHPDQFLGVYRDMAEGVNNSAGIHIDNLLKILDIMKAYAEGDMTPILDPLPGKQVIANERMDMLRNNLLLVIDELNTISDSVTNGRLDLRGDASKFQGAYSEIITGINGTLDAVINPLNITAEYIDRISKGDIPHKITDDVKGDFNEIKVNINQLIDNLNDFISEMQQMYEIHLEGDIEHTINASKFQGAYHAMAEGVNKSIFIHVNNILLILNVIQEYAEGNFDAVLKKLPGKQVIVNERMDMLRENLLNVVSELDSLASQVQHGNLEYNCDTSKFQKGWKELVEGLNDMKDSVAKPVEDMNEVLKNISVNNYQVEFEEGYEGAWLEQQNHTKDVISRLTHILKILRNLSIGNLEDLELLKAVGKRSENDELVPAFIRMIESIQLLVTDAEELAQFAEDGKLDKRVDASKHQGEYANVINGFNKTIDNLVNPLRVAVSFTDAISKGQDFDLLTDEYKGEYKSMAANINTCIGVLNRFSQDIFDQTKASINGQLDIRTDINEYQGSWQEMVKGMNNIMDAMAMPLNEAGQVLEVLAAGDLRARMKGKYEGEFDKLSLNINSLGNSLQDLIRNVIEVVSAVSEASNEINSNSGNVAAASQEQSSQAEEIATAIEEMAQTVTENATNASKTSDEAKNNGQIASKGGRIVSDTVKKMQDIAVVVRQSAENIQKLGESSTQIGQIISVIDEIADQTNLLALNAAIEAARAGEQGRGFAVVADEVRKLAERTTEATKQIATMIKGVQNETESAVGIMQKGNDEVKQGINLADEAGKSLANIVGSTNSVIEMIMQIASASEQQSATTEQIAKNITAISTVSQDTAQQISFIAEAANRMTEYTSQLNLVVNQFKIDDDHDTGTFSGNEPKHLMPH